MVSGMPSLSESRSHTRSVVLVQACVSTVPLPHEAAQLEQVLAPVVLLKLPAAQATGGASPPAQLEPAGQVLTDVRTCTLFTGVKVK